MPVRGFPTGAISLGLSRCPIVTQNAVSLMQYPFMMLNSGSSDQMPFAGSDPTKILFKPGIFRRKWNMDGAQKRVSTLFSAKAFNNAGGFFVMLKGTILNLLPTSSKPVKQMITTTK